MANKPLKKIGTSNPFGGDHKWNWWRVGIHKNSSYLYNVHQQMNTTCSVHQTSVHRYYVRNCYCKGLIIQNLLCVIQKLLTRQWKAHWRQPHFKFASDIFGLVYLLYYELKKKRTKHKEASKNSSAWQNFWSCLGKAWYCHTVGEPQLLDFHSAIQQSLFSSADYALNSNLFYNEIWTAFLSPPRRGTSFN